MSQEPQLKAVIFDLDGVLVDTSQLHADAWAEMARKEGVEPPADIKDQVRGISRMASLKIALGDAVSNYTEDELTALATWKNNRYLDMVKELTPDDLLPGVLELFDDMKANGVKIVLGSASKNAPLVLGCVGIVDRFDAIADGTCYERGKPHPDVFWSGARMVEAAFNECIVVEDAVAGITAALNGGFVGVGMGESVTETDAHLLIHDLRDVSVASLRDLHAKFAGQVTPSVPVD
jgi:beta-phosphoglucomutase